MPIKLYEHQKEAIEKMRNGSILCGGVGSGKSITSLAYYYNIECQGKMKINGEGGFSPMKRPKDLYIITTARKRDSLEWEKDAMPFYLSKEKENSLNGTTMTVDSWNNIGKYRGIKNAFFIFDEQRVVGAGKWSKDFIAIAKQNRWVMLSATPGDTWSDYVSVFIANGFYRNKTEFNREHVVFSMFAKFPKIERYVNVQRLIRHRNDILVNMVFNRKTIAKNIELNCEYNDVDYKTLMVNRWNIYEDRPIRDVAELCSALRKLVNSHPSRVAHIKKLAEKHDRLIIFYNFNYELEILREATKEMGITTTEWNGHKHEEIPDTKKWIYLVQYTAGAEGWNCTATDTIVFYSQNYSYKIVTQSAGRIDRLNTPFVNLYYYHLKSKSMIDNAIGKALSEKKDFNENKFMRI